MRQSLSLILACACLCATALAGDGKTAGGSRVYAQMSRAEQVAYVEAHAKQVSAMLSGSGRPIALNPDAIRLIKREVDDYANRVNSGSDDPWREKIGAVIERGAPSVPVIKRAFEAEGVPAMAGLYIAMIESEYHECLTSPGGAKGVFQFMPPTAQRFGVDPGALCDLEKSAQAAAKYIGANRAMFGTDGLGSVLALLSYNVGERNVQQDFQSVMDVAGQEERERAFWTVLAQPVDKKFSRGPTDEGSRYVPRFFAAAIVGENPGDFGIQAQPLSAH
jgi:transglycosylase-like protein with SLT domain